MAIREVLKMGDSRLLRRAKPVREFNTPALKALGGILLWVVAKTYSEAT